MNGIEYKGIKKPKPVIVKPPKISYRQTNFFQFGRFVLNRGRLNKENILLVKYPKNNGPVSKIRRTSITNDFKNLINDLFDTSTINIELQKQLGQKEQDLFELLLKLAGLDIQLNYKKHIMTVEDYKARFEVLRGAIMAGNHNPEIVKELINIIDILSNESIGIISQEDKKDLQNYLFNI